MKHFLLFSFMLVVLLSGCTKIEYKKEMQETDRSSNQNANIVVPSENGNENTNEDIINSNSYVQEEVSESELPEHTIGKIVDMTATGGYLTDIVTLLGFSSDGKYLAYMTNQNTQEAGFEIISFSVQDLVTDEIVWFARNDPDWSGETPDLLLEVSGFDYQSPWQYKGTTKPEDLYWSQNKEKLLEAFKKYGIEMKDYIPVYNSLSVDGFKVVQESGGGKAGIYVQSSNEKYAVYETGLYNMDGTFEEHGYPLDISIEGYISNQLNDRLVLVVREEYRGWEGPPNVMRYKFVGVDLKRAKG